jgi:rare lipoprotein A
MKRAVLFAALGLLASCGPAGADDQSTSALSGLRAFFARLFHHEKPPEPHPHYVVGAPYQAGGVWFYPVENFSYEASGLGMIDPPGHPPLTADGELYDAGAMAAAMPTIQLPAVAVITDLETGRSVRVRVNDRGPANPGRIVSVTPRVAALLGFPPRGVAQVHVALDTAASEALARQLRGTSDEIALSAAPRGAVTVADLSGSPSAAPSSPAGFDPVAAPTETVPLRLPEEVYQGSPRPGRLYVDCGTFSTVEAARRQMALLAGLPVRLERRLVNGEENDLVRIGPLESVDAADETLNRVLKAGIAGAAIEVETP